MRLLVSCHACQRCFDASGRAPGSRFRCHCGAVVTVEEPQGHDAAIVRCSNCGAPRSEGAEACPYCQATYTLHDRDLDAVCPRCLARVAGAARFCHHCGNPVPREAISAEETDLACPACGEEAQLISRQLPDSAETVLECPRCAGMWLDQDIFTRLTDRAQQRGLAARMSGGVSGVEPRRLEPQEGPLYRHCPVCNEVMNRRNYGKRSGVVIDTCRSHGVWLDAEELPAILAWLGSGGLERVRQLQADELARRERQASAGPIASYGSDYHDYGDARRGSGSLLETLLRGIGDLLS